MQWARLILICLLIAASSAEARFNFQSYRNRNSPAYTLLDSIQMPAEIDANPTFNSLVYHYFAEPVKFDQGEDGEGALISGAHNFNIAGEYAFSHKFGLGVDLPLHQVDSSRRGSSFAFGDARVFSRWGLNSNLSLVPSVYLPTGDKEVFLSNPNGGAGLNLVAEKRWSGSRVAVNLGIDYFPEATYPGVDYSFQNYLGVGYNRRFARTWQMQIEWIGRMISNLRTGDLYGGTRYQLENGNSLTMGASLASQDMSQYRVFAGVDFSMTPRKVITRYRQETIIQKSKTIHDCGPKPFKRNFKARALGEAEMKGLVLPFTSTSAQTVFAVDLEALPARAAVISLEALELNLNVSKKRAGGHSGMLCLLNAKVCSGDLPEASASVKANDQFFTGKEPPNDYFLKRLPPSGKGRVILPMERLLENSVAPDLLDLVYSRTLYFAASRDVQLNASGARLSVELKYGECREITPAPTVERRLDERHVEEVPVE